jgi:hypothetical protein
MPQTHRRAYLRRPAPIALVGVCALALAAGLALALTRPSAFPDQLPGSDSDVSATQALSDHHIGLPPSTHGLRYSAHQHTEDGDYPMAAQFAFPCAQAPTFTETDHLFTVEDPDRLLDQSVYDLATNLGWKPGTPGATWYQRIENGRADLSVLIQPTTNGCTAYLTSSLYTD